jgi:protein SCO1/2
MKLRLLLIAGLGLLAGALSAWIMISQAPPQGQVSTGKALVGGPFSLSDAAGKRVTDKDFAGKRMLVFFGFTNCPDVCPGGLQVIAGALDKLGPKADKLAPLFITLDPERDTPPKVAEFAASFSPRITGLSGTPDAVAAAAKAYRVYHKKVPGKDDPAVYNIDHTSLIYLMDENGQYVTHYPYPITADALAEKLSAQL